MADINFDELNNSLTNSASQLDGFTASIKNTSTSTGILTAANKNATEAIKQEAAALAKYKKNIKDGLSQVGNTAKDLGSSLAQGQSGFNSLNGVIDLSIKAITGIASGVLGLVPGFGAGLAKGAEKAGEIAADLTKTMVQQFQTGWDAYRQITDTGIVNNFTDLKDLSGATNLRFEQISAALGKYSGTIAAFNSQASFGANGFKDLAAASSQLRERMYVMGINSQDFAEFQAKYVDEQNRLGQTQGKNINQLVDGTQKYIEELDAQAKLFGLSRKEAQNARNIALSEDKFRASMNVISTQISDPKVAEQIKDAALKFNTSLQKQAPNVAAGMRDLFAGDGTSTSDVANELQAATGGEAGRIAAKLRRGEVDEIEARNQLITAMEKQNKSIASTVQFSNKSTAAKGYAERENLIASKKRTAEDVKSSKQNTAANDKTTQELAGSAQKLEHASQQLQDLATSSETMTAVMEKFSSGIDGLATMLNKKFGRGSGASGGAPEASSGVSGANQAFNQNRVTNQNTQSQNAANAEVQGGRIGAQEAKNILEGGSERDIKAFGGREALERIANPGQNQSSTSGRPAPYQKILDFIGKVESGGDYNKLVGGKTAGLTGMTIQQVTELQSTMKAQGFESTAIGKYQTISSTLREQVAKLKIPSNAKFDSTTQDSIGLNLLKYAGYDKYQAGKISADTFADSLASVWASLPLQNGQSRYQGTGSNKSLVSRADFVSALQARTGGIFRGPSTGYMAELSGDKAVIPANDGVAKQALNTASMEQGDDVALLEELYGMMNNKFERIVNLLNASDGYQAKLLRTMQ